MSKLCQHSVLDIRHARHDISIYLINFILKNNEKVKFVAQSLEEKLFYQRAANTDAFNIKVLFISFNSLNAKVAIIQKPVN